MNQKEKEKILFICPTVPRYDQNAGDLRIFSLVDILSKVYEIIYFPNYIASSEGGSDDRYIERLRSLGVCVPNGDCSLVEVLRKEKYKVAIIEYYFIAENYLPRIKILQPSCPVVIDSVDLHYYRQSLKYEMTKDREDLRRAREIKTRELAIYRKADVVIAITEQDAEILREDCPGLKLKVIPIIHRMVSTSSTAQNKELIYVGGFHHDPNVDAVLYFCRDILPLIRKVIPDINFTIVGSSPPPEIKNLSSDFIFVTGYVPSVTPYLQRSYISVAPLRYGAGMKNKIGEAMAHGLPVVTTSVGAQGMGLVDGRNGMIADSSESFAASVIELIQNESLYRTIQKKAVDHIKNNFSEVQVGRQILDILEEVGNLPVKKISLLEKAAVLFEYTVKRAKKKLSKAVTQ